MRSRLVAWPIIALALSLVAPAGAQPTAEHDNRKERAQALVTDGYRQAQAGDFLAALERFEAAYELFASPKILLNIGTSLRQLGRNAEAAAAYARYLQDPDADAARREEVAGILADIERGVGKVKLVNRVPGVRFSIDARPLAHVDPDGWAWIEPGSHIAVAETPRRDRTRRFHVGAGERMTLTMSFEEPKIEVETRVRTVERSVNTGQRTAGILLGSTGLSGMVAGAVVALSALRADGQADEHCDTAAGRPELCDAEGVELGIVAKERATAATATLVAGAAVLGLGIGLFVTATGEAPARVEAPSDGGLGIAVRF
jgi:hypothetical protein